MALPFHVRHGSPPPCERVLAHVEHADTGGHWYWTGDVLVDGIDPWPAYRDANGTWLVVRLLLPSAPGQRHVNTCGLRTCVNPEHWRLVSSGKRGP